MRRLANLNVEAYDIQKNIDKPNITRYITYKICRSNSFCRLSQSDFAHQVRRRGNTDIKRLTGTPEVKGYSFDLFLFVHDPKTK
jgi:hypothetical protein